ncbi:hypothetical protein [Tabrizicola caldifontis]|uniref:hypothetical protein n=1 Tax=Tabrizicola caldifontis TaxID=2528036 RepID=UPI0010802C49|nr:hypothetical protein [Rhodobacter sp. YIM 73028]
MRKAENLNAPNLGGWAIGAAAGLVAFGALVVVGKFDLFPAAFLGGVLAVLVGLILGMPWGATAPAQPGPRVRKIVPAPEASAAVASMQPVTAPAAPLAAAAAPVGPQRLQAPRNGRADDLKEIEGIGPALEKLLNSLGFYHFDQIAGWSDDDIVLVDAEMENFKGRIVRDRWVVQAKIIVSEGLEAFRERAKTNNY